MGTMDRTRESFGQGAQVPSNPIIRMTMAAEEEGGYIVATIEPSSAVYHSIYARFLAPTSHNIVIAYHSQGWVH